MNGLLLYRIKQEDEEAFNYIMNDPHAHGRVLQDCAYIEFGPSVNCTEDTWYSKTLLYQFSWVSTKLGTDFWRELHKLLRRKYGENYARE